MTGKPHSNTNPRGSVDGKFYGGYAGNPHAHTDLSNKEISQSTSYSSTSRLSSDPAKSSGYARRRGDSSNFLYALEPSIGIPNRGLYNNSGGGGGGSASQTPQTDGVELQSHQRPPPPSQPQSRKMETKMAAADLLQTSTELGKPGLLSHISPLRAPQTSSPSAYQPNLVPISVSPHSPQFFADSNTPPNRQHHLQFHQPPPPLLGPLETVSQQPSRGYACQSAWGLPGTQDCGSEPVGNALNNSSTAAPMIGDMSLLEYRRTYSDSCIPSSFPDASNHSRCFPPHQQYHRQQNQPLPPPPQPFPPPLQQQRQQQCQQQRTLPPVDELTLPRYQNTNSSTISNSSHAPCFNGSPLSSRCRHQSSTTMSQQPFRRLQSDYHSMRNIPQRYAPVHHHHHNSQETTTPVQPLVMQPPAGGEGYPPGSMPLPYQTWNMNGGGDCGGSVSTCDLPSSSSTLRSKRSDVCSEYRPKPSPLQLLPQTPQMSTTMGYENHSARSVVSSSSSDGGGGYFGASVADPLAYHQPQSSCASSMLSSAAATAANNNGGGSIAVSSSASLTQPLDISVLDSDAFPSPEQEGRRDSFSMAVDLLSRLEKRPLDASLASSSASTASPPPPSLPTTTGTPLWSSTVACPPPSKSAKFDPTATSTDNAASAFFVPIAANDLQLLTEPSMANYVTDAATEDQLVREQYSPT
ncbi:hypothetical protein TcWFU_008208 [Taenia crassiceps]|uniref:Uncharacterized protein n=1 Tax=Taenia crassiceps TaxID=6207 RepID=A0ABR4Q447_9CEST